jgi:hypothetical protein
MAHEIRRQWRRLSAAAKMAAAGVKLIGNEKQCQQSMAAAIYNKSMASKSEMAAAMAASVSKIM